MMERLTRDGGLLRLGALLWVFGAWASYYVWVLRTTHTLIGHGVSAECGRPASSQIARIVIAMCGVVAVIGAADDGGRAHEWRIRAGTLFVLWLAGTALLPLTYVQTCAN